MNERDRRKTLKEQFKQSRPEAGVYRILNRQNNKSLLGSTPNLAGMHNKLAFAKSTNSPGALDYRLHKDIRQFGLESFSLEVLEVLESMPETTPQQILEDLATLEALWREKLDHSQLY